MKSRDSRQGFLGPHARKRLNTARVGIVGYGGGGSHVVQQLAHVLAPNLTIFEPQSLEDTNLNRVVGGREDDVDKPKLAIAKRVIEGLMPMNAVELIPNTWQESPQALRRCHLVVGCVDSAQQREELERECRRWLIPYVDIGLGVTLPGNEQEDPLVAGQVAMSVPGEHCLRCFGVVTEAALQREAENYGDKAPAPQVVWSNGVLASLAVGMVVEMITAWKKNPSPHRMLRYDSSGIVAPPVELPYRLPAVCPHYDLAQAGPVQLVQL